MRDKRYTKIFLYINIALILLLVFYKTYLFIYESDFHDKNLINIKKIKESTDQGPVSFAVLGNIENSIDIFDRKIIDNINGDKDLDFVISTGNAVFDGEEDKYRLLNKSLKKLDLPSIVGIGKREISDEGADRFYRHFGPFYFSFNLNNTYFIFLDTTGKTSISWQKEWLNKEFNNAQKYSYIFVFMNRAPFKFNDDVLFKSEDYLRDNNYRSYLNNLFSRYNVTGVFATGSPGIYKTKKIKGVKYYLSGGAGGGLLVPEKNSYYHYLRVKVNSNGVSVSTIKEQIPAAYKITRILANIWAYIHSLFYINFANFILIISVLVLIGIVIHIRASKEVDYYRDFSNTGQDLPDKQKLNIAMFTNNYLPFIGGVPISIERLVKGLRRRGHDVYIFAPEYPGKITEDENYIIRCNLLTNYKSKQFKFAIVNIFSPEIENHFNKHNFDIIHVHHPFWMGSKGLKLAKKYQLPVILTYHTRLEKYAHFLPFFKLIFKNILSHKLIRRFSQKCNAIIAPTNTAKEYLDNIGVSRDKIVQPTGIDFDDYNNIDDKDLAVINDQYKPEGEILLCSVSRLSKEKNIYFLIQAIKYIKDHTEIPFRCIIIGDGPEKEDISKIVENKNLQGIVSLLGSISPQKIPVYYKASDIFVFSSLSETQGMVILEAMAGGTPVVAVRSSGIDDVIKNGYNGFKTKEDIETWANKVIYLMKNQRIKQELSHNAFQFAGEFSLDKMAENVEEVYYKAVYDKKKIN